ncbi:MAG: endonuclease/exonuclease/phosphatase family protein [Bacteroidia bacterium]
MKTLLLVLASLLVIASFIPLLRNEEWWIRIFDFPRIQIVFFSVLTITAFFIFFDTDTITSQVIMSLLLASILYQGWEMLPYTPLWKIQSVHEEKEDKGNTVRLLISNVRQKNRDTQKLLDLVREKKPDILLAVETDDYWYSRLKILENEYAYSKCKPLNNTYGVLLFSNLELINAEFRFLVDEEVPSIKTEVALPSGNRFVLYCIHPKPPAMGKDTEDRDAELVVIGKESRKLNSPVMVAGDLNDVAWSHTTRMFQRISGLLDPRRGRGFFNTFNANIPFFRWPLDHVFHSDHFQLKKLEVCRHIGSDHFPVLIELVFIPDEKHEQEKPKADEDDREEGEEKLVKAGVA